MPQRRSPPALALTWLSACALLASCQNNTIPVTVSGQTCMTDDDCDPGDNCIQGMCQGDSSDGGAPDAGSADGGTADGGAADGGTADAGRADGGAADAGHDGGGDGGGSRDGGVVTFDGGAVDLLDFAFTGDTRPANCDDATGGQAPYPQAVFEGELTQMAALSPQFGFDLGDHMYVCSNSAANAKAEMKLYTDALAAQWPAALPFFMTMGNHECQEGDCSNNPNDPNWDAYAAALQSVSRQTLPYYSLQIATRLGRASFLFVADHYFDSAAQSWLKSALKDADANSAYTFIVKHYPVTGSRAGPASITSLIEAHHFSLVMTAHEHQYAHDTTTAPWSGRSVICGLGGANTSTGNEGFCRVQQQADGSLVFTQYGLGGNPGDTWSVSARQ